MKRQRSHPLQKAEKEYLSTYRVLVLTFLSGDIMDHNDSSNPYTNTRRARSWLRTASCEISRRYHAWALGCLLWRDGCLCGWGVTPWAILNSYSHQAEGSDCALLFGTCESSFGALLPVFVFPVLQNQWQIVANLADGHRVGQKPEGHELWKETKGTEFIQFWKDHGKTLLSFSIS